MDIFFINFDLSDNKINPKQPLGLFHHKYSRIFLKQILEKFYNIKTPINQSGTKPFLEDNSMNFSISHSNNTIAIAFDTQPIGFDIEFKKERNFLKLLKFLNINCQNISATEFYQIWTIYEAEFKSGITTNLISFIYKNYICSLSSENSTKPMFYEINIAKNEFEFKTQKINITNSDFLPPTAFKIKKEGKK